MSTISRLYDATASTEREGFITEIIEGVPTVSTVKRAYTANLASVPCHIQPLEAELAQTLPGGIGKSWLMFCNNCDIKENDKVIVGTINYRVSGVETYTHSRNPHMEVIITAFKN